MYAKGAKHLLLSFLSRVKPRPTAVENIVKQGREHKMGPDDGSQKLGFELLEFRRKNLRLA